MNGSAIRLTGNKLSSNLVIHFQPGSRGDFLAGFILNNLRERDNGALHQSQYKKVHYGFDRNQYQECVCMRIDENHSVDALMQSVYNHFLKNPTEFLDDRIDHFYTHIKDRLSRELIDPANYDYWMDFSSINNIDFLTGLYYHFNRCPPPQELVELAKENINKQVHWTVEPGLDKLSLLVDFEWRFNLRNWNKTFSVQEFMLDPNAEKLLTFKNYSREPFIL